MQALLARAQAPERRVLRFYGASESAVASALAAAGGDGDGVEVTICARDSEIHVDLFSAPEARERALELESRLVEPIAGSLYATTATPIEELVLDLCRERGLTLATAESCTGGLVAVRLTSVPGSSAVFLGGIVAYANEVKESLLGVPAEVLAAYGAVSAETAVAMAHGARERLGADLAVSVTGIAGPGGGTPGEAGRARPSLRRRPRRRALTRIRRHGRPGHGAPTGDGRRASPSAHARHGAVEVFLAWIHRDA